MKQLFSILILLSYGFAVSAQVTETEPNNNISQANALAINTVMSGQSCTSSDPDFFRIILPSDGELKVNTTASIPDANLSAFTVTVVTKSGASLSQYNPAVGENGIAAADSFVRVALAADTFYLEVFRSSAISECFSYTLKWKVLLPSYNADAEPDQFPSPSIFMSYNTPVDGHLGFFHDFGVQSDATDCFSLLSPSNGALKLNLSSEAEASSDYTMDVALYTKTNSGFGPTQYPAAGPFQSPLDTVLYWPCVSADTFRVVPFITNIADAGYAYRMSYTVVAPAYANDDEPNNSFSQAQVVNPQYPIEGNEYFAGDPSGDYYKFYKPDTGELKIYIKAETWQGAAQGSCYVQLFDHNESFINVEYAPIGLNSQPASDSLILQSLAADSFYIQVYNNAAAAPCMSYQLTLKAAGIFGVGIQDPTVLQQLNVYPNPSSGAFMIDMKNIPGATNLLIYNMVGQLVEQRSVEYKTNTSIGGNWSSGSYMLEVTGPKGELLAVSHVIKTD